MKRRDDIIIIIIIKAESRSSNNLERQQGGPFERLMRQSVDDACLLWSLEVVLRGLHPAPPSWFSTRA
jgi:hypothetical protein